MNDAAEKRAKAAIWKWFLTIASLPETSWSFGTPRKIDKLRAHLATCSINLEQSYTPCNGSYQTYDTFGPSPAYPSFVVTYWLCACGEYTSRSQGELTCEGEMSLSDVILGVLEIEPQLAEALTEVPPSDD